jgi:hypothetical protein
MAAKPITATAEVHGALQTCLLVYGEKPGLLVIGFSKFWDIVRALGNVAGVHKDSHEGKSPVLCGLPVLITARDAYLLLAVPESMADKVRIKMQAEEGI